VTAPHRRPVAPAAEDTSGRTGCVILGAVLGVVAGALFAFYGLPPILRSFYGETKVAYGETYTGDAKEIRVELVEAGGGQVRVTLAVLTNKTWEPNPAAFRLELSTGGDWIEAAAPEPSIPETSFDFDLGVSRTLVLVFPLPAGSSASPKALHLSDPLVSLSLSK